MKATLRVSALTCMMLFLSSCGDYVNVGGLKYRKTGAINADIFYLGVKRGEGKNKFDPKTPPVLEKEILVRNAGIIYNEETRSAFFEALLDTGEIPSIDVDGEFGGKADVESKSKGEYQIFKFYDTFSFVDELNKDANKEKRERLARYKDPRIITSVAVAFGHEERKKISSSGKIRLAYNAKSVGGPEIIIKAGNTNEKITSLSDGTVFAFEYSRICWEEGSKNYKIASIEVDRPGLDNSCPKGSTDDFDKI